MFDEVKKSVTTAIESRLNNQIVGSFSISWCLFNWKAIVIIVFPSSISLAARFTELEAQGYVGLKPYDHMLFYPALSTLLILFVVPYFSLRLVSWETWIQNQKNLIRKKLIEVMPIDEVNLLNDQIATLRQEARNNELAFENRGKQVKEREAEVADLKKSIVDITSEQNIFKTTIFERDQTIKSLAAEKEASAKDRAAFQDEFDSQKNQLAKNLEQILEEEKRSADLLQEADRMKRNYEEAITNRDNEIRLLKDKSMDIEYKRIKLNSELEQLKKSNKPLTLVEQLEELLKPAMEELDVRVESGREKFNRKILDSLANGLTDGLNIVSIDINILIDKLRTGKISKEELFDLRNKLIAGQKDNLKAAMIIKKLSDAQRLLFPNKNK